MDAIVLRQAMIDMKCNFSSPMTETCLELLHSLDGKGYHEYRKLKGKGIEGTGWHAEFVHIQGSPGANPASMILLRLHPSCLGLPAWATEDSISRLATGDYLLRALGRAINQDTKPNRGDEGSGSYQAIPMPQQILERNTVSIGSDDVEILLRLSLPAVERKIKHQEALAMLTEELPLILMRLSEAVDDSQALRLHCDTVQDSEAIRERLEKLDLVAFIANGSILPRESGSSDKPMESCSIPFEAPETLAVEIDFPRAGVIRGLGVRSGISVLVGGGFHGKSTMLKALSHGIYPHVPGDGRERVIVRRDACLVPAEDGRSVAGTDISAFISDLPDGSNGTAFKTNNASGSTSQAAGIVESVLAGSRLLLIDEDTSATNFLFRDHRMRDLIPEDPITPLFDRVEELFDKHRVSSVVIAGGSSSYLAVAKTVIAMRKYRPVDMTKEATSLDLPNPEKPEKEMVLVDERRLGNGNFDPAYRNERLGKSIQCRIKPLRGEPRKLEYGKTIIDLSALDGLVDPDQLHAVGYLLLLAFKEMETVGMSPTSLARELSNRIDENGLQILNDLDGPPHFFAKPRVQDVANAINRLRKLVINAG